MPDATAPLDCPRCGGRTTPREAASAPASTTGEITPLTMWDCAACGVPVLFALRPTPGAPDA